MLTLPDLLTLLYLLTLPYLLYLLTYPSIFQFLGPNRSVKETKDRQQVDGSTSNEHRGRFNEQRAPVLVPVSVPVLGPLL